MGKADDLILVLYLVLLTVVTWRCRRTGSKPEEFFLAGRKFGALPVGLSVMVTSFSAVNYLALPGEVCGFGLYVIASILVFFLAAWPITRWWMPFFVARGNVSVYSFLEERFDRKVRNLASGLFIVWRIVWMAIALYASCRIMALLTGVSFHTVLWVCTLTAAGYSAIGGMRAVVWTDVMQFIVLFGSILAGTILACRGEDFSLLAASGALKPFSPVDWSYLSPDPRLRITLWSALLGTGVTFLTRFGADQMVMQRYAAARSLQEARRGLWLNAVAAALSLGILVIFGLALKLFALRLGPGQEPLQLAALLLKSLPPGMTGLVGAGLLAATMSSIDSGLNSCSAAISADFLMPLKKQLSPRLLTVLLMIPVLTAAGWLLPELNRNNTLFVILCKSVNTIGTPLLAVMLCALFIKKSEGRAVFYGTVAGIILTVLGFVWIKTLALHYYSLLSLLLTFGMIGIFHAARKIRL